MVDARTPSSVSSGAVIGRTEVFENVDRLLARLREGHGQGLLLVGALGVGKTHVLHAVLDRGIGREFRILSGRARAEELPPPFSLVRDLLGSRSDEETPASEAEGTAPRPIFPPPFSREVASHPRTSSAESTTTAEQDDLERILAPTRQRSGEGLRGDLENLLGRIEDYFRTLAKVRPLLLAIDDLHLSDTSSLEFLWHFALDMPEIPVAVIATVSVGAEVPERTRALLENLNRSPAFHSVPVRAFNVPEVAEFVREILGGRTPDPKDVLRWHAQTDGNPLFIEQLVRAVTGFVPSAEGLPQTTDRNVTEVLVTRVRALGENEQSVLTNAAVLGKEFEFSNLVAVAGLGESRVTKGLDRLVRVGLLREKGDGVYEFVTEAVRARVYADMTETQRRTAHHKAGLTLESKGGGWSSELARHFYLGHDNDRAVKYNVASAHDAVRAFAFETAVTYVARALDAERRRPERDVSAEIRLLTEEGRLLTEMDSLNRSGEVLAEAVGLARSHPGLDLELGRALLGLAQCRHHQGEYTTAETLATEALTLLTAGGANRDLMATHQVLGEVYMRFGELPKAEAHQRAALEIAERAGTSLDREKSLVNLANVLMASGPGRFEPALELYARAANLSGEGGDYVGRARVLMNRAVLEWTAGRTDEALGDFTLAIEAAERSHSARWIGYCNINLAQLQAEQGRTALARPPLERTVHVFAAIGDDFIEQQILMTRGMIAHADREFDQAEANFLESLALARKLHLPSETSEVLLRLAELSHDRGDDSKAREQLADARASGLLDHRPDFAPRVAALEQSLAAPPSR